MGLFSVWVSFPAHLCLQSGMGATKGCTKGMVEGEPYLLFVRKALIARRLHCGCSELPALYSVVNYPGKTWQVKLVLSTGLTFFFLRLLVCLLCMVL